MRLSETEVVELHHQVRDRSLKCDKNNNNL